MAFGWQRYCTLCSEAKLREFYAYQDFVWLTIAYYFVYIRFKKSSNSSLVFIYSKKCVIFYEKNYSKKFSGMQALGMCLTYVKRYFQPHQWNVVYFMAQITQILLFLGMPILERSSQFNNDTFSKKISALDVLGIFRYLT